MIAWGTVSAWARAEKGVRTLGDILRLIASPQPTWPLDILAALRVLSGVKVTSGNAVRIRSARWRTGSRGSTIAGGIYSSSAFLRLGRRQPSDHLAKPYGVTRERMRQIEGKI